MADRRRLIELFREGGLDNLVLGLGAEPLQWHDPDSRSRFGSNCSEEVFASYAHTVEFDRVGMFEYGAPCAAVGDLVGLDNRYLVIGQVRAIGATVVGDNVLVVDRSEEHTSELQSRGPLV